MNRKSRKKEALTPYERRKRRLEKRFSTAPKTTGQKVAGAVIDNICWIVGCSLYSIGVVAFALPNSIAQSGTTGLAIIVNHLFEFIPLGTANFLLNVPLMILAFIFIGWRFVAKTMWVTVILSATLDLFSKFLPTYTGDKILAAIFCGVCTGAGLAIVFMRGATTGGTDIVGRLVHKAFPHIQIGKVIMAADAIIVILGAVVFRSIESAMYAVIVIFVNSRLLDYILYGTGSGLDADGNQRIAAPTVAGDNDSRFGNTLPCGHRYWRADAFRFVGNLQTERFDIFSLFSHCPDHFVSNSLSF